MRAVLAYALRRSSSRLVFLAGAAGLVAVVYRAVRPLRWVTPGDACGACLANHVHQSSHWDLAIGSLCFLIAIVAAAALYRGISIGR